MDPGAAARTHGVDQRTGGRHHGRPGRPGHPRRVDQHGLPRRARIDDPGRARRVHPARCLPLLLRRSGRDRRPYAGGMPPAGLARPAAAFAQSQAPATPTAQQAGIVRDFKQAWEAKDIDALIGLLDPDATAIADGGGLASAAPPPDRRRRADRARLRRYRRQGTQPDAPGAHRQRPARSGGPAGRRHRDGVRVRRSRATGSSTSGRYATPRSSARGRRADAPPCSATPDASPFPGERLHIVTGREANHATYSNNSRKQRSRAHDILRMHHLSRICYVLVSAALAFANSGQALSAGMRVAASPTAAVAALPRSSKSSSAARNSNRVAVWRRASSRAPLISAWRAAGSSWVWARSRKQLGVVEAHPGVLGQRQRAVQAFAGGIRLACGDQQPPEGGVVGGAEQVAAGRVEISEERGHRRDLARRGRSGRRRQRRVQPRLPIAACRVAPTSRHTSKPCRSPSRLKSAARTAARSSWPASMRTPISSILA